MVLSQCAACGTRVCQVGDREHGPEACPMHGDFPSSEDLYVAPEVRDLARVSALVESAGYRRWTRAEEVMELARRMGYSRLGVAFCSDTANIANMYMGLLKASGFDAVVAGPSDGACDPIAAAETCNKRGTQLNVLLCMHVGHDSLFIRHSKAWVTSLVARDRVLVHNPIGAIYGAKGYFREALAGHRAGPVPAAVADTSDEQLAAAANDVIIRGSGRWTRVEETMELAGSLGVSRLGLVFCMGLSSEAAVLAGILESNGFEVASVGCKTGGVPKEFMGVLDSQKVRPGKPEMMCNPIAQVEVLNRSRTGLNILMGQCVGHDGLSMRHSSAPVVCLVAKDRVLAHNTAAALYESEGYLRANFHRHDVDR